MVFSAETICPVTSVTSVTCHGVQPCIVFLASLVFLFQTLKTILPFWATGSNKFIKTILVILGDPYG